MSVSAKQRLWTRVEAARAVAPGIHEMRLHAPAVARTAQPGQFVHLRVGEGFDPLLRRPLSIGEVQGESVDLLYRVVGHGTEMLSQAEVGERFDVIGPLGHPFALHLDRAAILVAGGLGIAVFPLLAQRLREGGCPEMHLIYGARSEAELVWASRVRTLGAETRFATDDGSAGRRGPCTELLGDVIASASHPPAIYACGPEAMFRALLRTVTDPSIPIQLSYEQRMGCGFGACMACAVETKSGYVRACCDGPVLDGALFR